LAAGSPRLGGGNLWYILPGETGGNARVFKAFYRFLNARRRRDRRVA
jgi:hypothetical protein